MLESVNDVQHKKHAVTEFLDAEKGSDRNIHQCLYNINGKSVVDRSTVSRCLIRATTSETTVFHDLPRSLFWFTVFQIQSKRNFRVFVKCHS